MLEREKLPIADLGSGGFLLAFGMFLVGSAFRMPMGGTYGGVQNPWYASPGALPIMIGSLLILCALGIVIRALMFKPQALFSTVRGWLFSPVQDTAVQRSLVILALLAGYAGLLNVQWFSGCANLFEKVGCDRLVFSAFLTEAGGANYFLSSTLFLTTFIWMFHRGKGPKKLRLALAAGVGALVPLALGYVFSGPLMVPLP